MHEIPPPVPDVDHAERWRLMVERRRAQMDAAYDAAGISSADYWSRRAKSYRAALHQHMDEDPFLQRVRDAVDGRSTVLDVGAGTGRHTLALAPHVRRVTAVDPSAAMLALLREDATSAGFDNIEAVEKEWPAAAEGPGAVATADVVICSHVLYPVAAPLPFVRALEARARERVFIYLRIDPLPTDLGLWSEFYGQPLQMQPSALDLLNLLAQSGILPSMDVSEHRFTWTFATLDDAVSQVRNTLCLRDDDAPATARLRSLLEERLVSWPGGRLGPRIEAARSAILSWRPQV